MSLNVNEINLLETSLLSEDYKKQVFDLWNSEYPTNLKNATLEDMLSYMEGLENLRHGMVVDDKGRAEAWFATYRKEKENRFILIVSSSSQGKGLGSFIMDHLKKGKDELFGWVIDHNDYKKESGEPYQSPLEFYRKHGFEILDQRLERPFISAVKVRWTRE